MAQGAPAMGDLEPGLGHLEPKQNNATNFLIFFYFVTKLITNLMYKVIGGLHDNVAINVFFF